MNYRWECPKCEGAIIAPSRLRKTDTRRYCMKCSAKAPKLIERSAPTLVKKRTERAATVKAKRDASKQRAHEISYVVEGVDCLKLMKDLLCLPVYGGRDLVIHRCAYRPRKYGHWNDWQSEIHLFVWPGITEASLRETMIHELMHCAQRTWPCHEYAFNSKPKCKRHHCRHFKSKMVIGWRQAERKLGAMPGGPRPGSKYLQNGSIVKPVSPAAFNGAFDTWRRRRRMRQLIDVLRQVGTQRLTNEMVAS